MPNQQQAKFVNGSIMRHITVMSTSGAVGLMALFLVDLVDMFFISLLGQVELAAAIGFAGTIVFFSTSVSIGTSIAMGALVSRALGSGNREEARKLTGSIMVFAAIVSAVTVGIILFFVDPILALIGAQGEAAQKAKDFLVILLPGAPLMAMGMSAGAALRGVGDAKLSMAATLISGAVNAILDPIFIFGLSMGIEGAATASLLSRFVLFGVAFHAVHRKHDLVARPTFADLSQHFRAIMNIAGPAIVTNTATPIGNAIVTAQIAKFGADYVAGYAVMGRLLPVSFALIFSLSGAVGPILGQNYGAQKFDRVQQTLSDSVKFVTAYCVVVALILFLAQGFIIDAFSLDGDASSMVTLFCTYIAITFIFNGTLFVSNAAFNNLNRPTWSTLLNVGKATLGTIPFVYVGGYMGGAEGVLIGQAVGSVLFGIAGYILVKKLIAQLARDHEQKEEDVVAIEPAVPVTAFSSFRAVMAEESESAINTDTDKKDAAPKR
ncbi:MATE family efflux transporter [Enterovibrio norvegicus FF-33]|uniref:Multidrug resistance protein NorM n=1 Tax=Enterovibrio norvegicus FF-454 TaxID=1185651 RepID=A0A1E5C0Y3_9GAMM|nr:MATE family efflux transporter [Enterovibrio norvegicus]OEE59165.1 MATE family efflux transporter [Enterovibrio norvegicus FF-454]OEE67678.1 MATE family efflux transporter [Enterovibrio norvegicus FF-33]OEE76312.1 MATE family efflux transporter [Enterovibrio norvegicus FF-162]